MSASPRRVVVLGSTGSIGRSTLDVLEHLQAAAPGSFEVTALAAGGGGERLAEQARRFGVRDLALAEERADGLDACRDVAGRVRIGPDAAERLVEEVEADLVVAAIVGSAGLPATLAALRLGRDLALANKETLVAAGPLMLDAARTSGSRLLPVDSEHSAIFQCLESRGRDHAATGPDDADSAGIARLVLTASGGPFRTWSAERIASATVEDALDHPTWSMGPKITIDSATLFNKALEMIEARWLFDLDETRIDVIVHPASIVHSFVEFVDGSVLAQLGPPDMKVPIQHALTYPARIEGCGPRLDWTSLSTLEFEPPDQERFPALRLARRVMREGGTSGAIFNAANEAAVELFLHRRIALPDIARLVEKALDEIAAQPVEDLATVMGADLRAREVVYEHMLSHGN